MNRKLSLRFFKPFFVFLLSLSLSLSNPFLAQIAYAASSPWTQTDWSGGSGQTAWSDATKYSSASSVDTSTTAGQATLTNTEQLTNTGFESDLNSWSYSADQTLTTSGNEITDITRTTNTQGDGVTPPDSSYGIWPAAVNKVTNGGFETNATGWAASGANTIAQSNAQVKFGGKSLKCTFQDSVTFAYYDTTLTAVAYIGSVWVYVPSDYDGATVRVTWYNFTGGTVVGTNANLGLRDQWQRVSATITPDAGDLSGQFVVVTNSANPTAGKFIYVDGVQLETGNIATPYIETNGATAARSASRVQAPSSVLNATQGWVAMRVRMGGLLANLGTGRFWTWVLDNNNRLSMYTLPTGYVGLLRYGGGVGSQANIAAAPAVGDVITVIGRWEVARHSISYNGSAFTNSSTTAVPNLSTIPLSDIGAYSAGDQLIKGTVLWTAMGTGTLTDADASTINGYGNTDPTINSIPSTANTTFVWSADTSTYTAGSVARDTSTTYSSSVGSAKVISPQTTGNFTQSVNVGDTNTYTLSAYAYTDGSAVTSSDLELLYNGSTISTTYTSVGSGWYKLTGTLTGANASRAYGVQVKAGKTVYVDNFSLNRYAASGTLTSSIFDSGTGTDGSNWGTLTYNATTPTNTSVSLKAKTSSSSTMTGATDFSTCTAITSGSDISSNSCVTDGHRYIQYQLTLTTTDTASSTPTFSDISIAFAQRDATAPVSIDLDSPGDNSYTNNERPTFKWKATTDATSGLSKYVLEIDNPSIGSTKPSGDFTIDNIPTSGTSESVNNKYVIHFDGFSDSDATNNYISVYTKSSSDWSTSENDGKLREGRVSWKVKAVDNAGNETSSSRTLFVDRTNPNVEFTQINSTPYTSNNFSTTDKTPTIFGKITDPLGGPELAEGQTQTENEPKVASGPKEVNIKVEKKTGLTYSLVTLYKVNMDISPYYTCESGKTIDNSKQKCDKYLPFSYTPEQNLDLGTYKITISGKDKADNSSSETSFTLNITTFAQITTSEEKAAVEEQSKNLKPEEQQKIQEEMEITKPTEEVPVSALEKAGQNITQAGKNFFDGLGTLAHNVITGVGNGIAYVFNGVGSGIAFYYNTVNSIDTFAFNKTSQILAFIGNGIGTGLNNVGQAIGSGYNNLAQHSSGFTKNILIAIGNGFGSAGNFIGTLANNMGTGIHTTGNAIAQGLNNTKTATQNGIANITFAIGVKTEDISNVAGVAIIKIGYLFVPEPTKISGVKVAKSTSNSMTITWETNHPANGKVNYGLTADYGKDIQTDKRITKHEFTVKGLKPNTTYYYEVMSQNRNYVYDANHTFTTPKK